MWVLSFRRRSWGQSWADGSGFSSGIQRQESLPPFSPNCIINMLFKDQWLKALSIRTAEMENLIKTFKIGHNNRSGCYWSVYLYSQVQVIIWPTCNKPLCLTLELDKVNLYQEQHDGRNFRKVSFRLQTRSSISRITKPKNRITITIRDEPNDQFPWCFSRSRTLDLLMLWKVKNTAII